MADILSNLVFGSELIEFCYYNQLDFIDKYILFSSYFTYISQAHGTTSWLDHCITTAAGRSLTSNVNNTDNVNYSDHFSLTIDMVCAYNIDHIFDCKF